MKRVRCPCLWVYELLRRHRLLGPDGLKIRFKRRSGDARAIIRDLRAQIVELRAELLPQGLDARAQSISYKMIRRNGRTPSISTIWRSPRNQGLIVYRPKRKPRIHLEPSQAVKKKTWESDVPNFWLTNKEVVGATIPIFKSESSVLAVFAIAAPWIAGVCARFENNARSKQTTLSLESWRHNPRSKNYQQLALFC